MASACGNDPRCPGTLYSTSAGPVCAVRMPVVVEEGFACPDHLPEHLDLVDVVACHGGRVSLETLCAEAGIGCTPTAERETPPHRVDAGQHGGSTDDAAPAEDEVREQDAGMDADGVDAGVVDTGVQDSSAPDSNIPDASAPDSNIPDASIPDSSTPEPTAADAGADAAIEECSYLVFGYSSLPGCESFCAACPEGPRDVGSYVCTPEVSGAPTCSCVCWP